MRYILKNKTATIFEIIDSKPLISWENEICTLFKTKGSKIDRPNLVHKSLNLRDELIIKPQLKTKKELLEIIKKYQ